MAADPFVDGLDHPECVAVHPDGPIRAGGEAGQIYRISPDVAEVEAIARTGRAAEVFVDYREAYLLSNPTNIAFGGSSFDQLFSANLGRRHLTRIDADVRGAPLACHAR